MLSSRNCLSRRAIAWGTPLMMSVVKTLRIVVDFMVVVLRVLIDATVTRRLNWLAIRFKMFRLYLSDFFKSIFFFGR